MSSCGPDRDGLRDAVQDVLDCAARAEDSTAVGRRYRGLTALRRVNALRCTEAMSRLAADPEFALEHIEQGAVILVRRHKSSVPNLEPIFKLSLDPASPNVCASYPPCTPSHISKRHHSKC